MKTMIRWLRHMLLWCALAGAVSAGGGGHSALKVFDAAALAPADVDLLICVQDAGEIRRSEIGGAAGAMAALALGEGETARAWSALAAQLGWSREEAFDRLLGSRVALVVRGLPTEQNPEFGSWALLSEVSLDTEKRLRERLRVAPRAIVAGHTVLSVEGGAYELTAERRAKHATLILAPLARNALFDELIPLLDKGPATPLSATPEFAELRALGGGQFLFFAQSPDRDGAWGGFIARREGAKLVANVVAAPRRDEAADCEPMVWDAGPARRAGEEALLWSVERSLPAAFGSAGVSTLLSGLPVMRLRERAADLLGDYLGVWVTAAPQGLPEFAAALEVQDLNRAPAQADGLMAELLAGVGLEGLDFAGVEPLAVRRVDLGASEVIRESKLWEVGPEARWSFLEGGERAPARAWWLLGLGEGAYELAARALEPQRPGGAEDMGAWVALGGVKPGAAIEALKGAGLKPSGPILAASKVREVRWGLELERGAAAERGRLRGTIEAVFFAPAPKPASAKGVGGQGSR